MADGKEEAGTAEGGEASIKREAGTFLNWGGNFQRFKVLDIFVQLNSEVTIDIFLNKFISSRNILGGSRGRGVGGGR